MCNWSPRERVEREKKEQGRKSYLKIKWPKTTKFAKRKKIHIQEVQQAISQISIPKNTFRYTWSGGKKQTE